MNYLEAQLREQKRILSEWKGRLNTKCYKALETFCKKWNNTNEGAYYVVGRATIVQFIHNWEPEFGVREIELKLGQLAQDHLGSCSHRKMVAILSSFYGDIKLESSLSIAIKNSKIKTPQDLEHFVANFNHLRTTGKLEAYYHGWKPLGKG